MMILSKKTRYAMLALTKLAKEYGNGAILISEIAKSENLPQRFLENILQELKKLGEPESYYLKAMNCPHHHRIFAAEPR
ncbi:MAG: Rrf2 family transcriptional regulator, partial [Bacteroidales bacterium]